MNDITYAGKHLQTYSVSRHEHSSYEFIYCTSGHGIFSTDTVTLHYGTGDIVVVPPHVWHSNMSAAGFTNIYLNIDNATLNFSEPFIISDDTDLHVLRAFQDAFYHYHSSFDKKRMLTSAFGTLLVSYILAYSGGKQLTPIVETIEANIVQNFPDAQYELDEYLQSLPFSYDYLRKLFKKEIGETPHGYLMNLRLSTAAHMLDGALDDDTNITRVAHLCGFKEPLYFSRVFKQHYGLSPANYIKQKEAAVDPTASKATGL